MRYTVKLHPQSTVTLRPESTVTHPLSVLDGDLALGARPDAVFEHLPVAGNVQNVSAGEHLAAAAGRVHVLQADAAVGVPDALHAL